MRSVTAAPHGTPRRPREIREERRPERRGVLPDQAEGPRGGREPAYRPSKPPRRFGSARDLGLFLFFCVVPFHRPSFLPPPAFYFPPPRLPFGGYGQKGDYCREAAAARTYLSPWFSERGTDFLYFCGWRVCVSVSECVCVWWRCGRRDWFAGGGWLRG